MNVGSEPRQSAAHTRHDAWLPAAELVARVKVVLRFSDWLAESYDQGTLGPPADPKHGRKPHAPIGDENNGRHRYVEGAQFFAEN